MAPGAADCALVLPLAGAPPVHALVLAVAPGSGTVIIGLTPPLSISVESSGIAPPIAEEEPAVLPGAESDEAMPLAGGSCEVEQASDPALVVPPPSNVELVPDIDAPEPLMLQFGLTAGLRPPGSISVAPSGIPVPFDAVAVLEPSVPSGDVGPIAAGVVVLCASAAPALNTITAVIHINRRIAWSPSSCLYRSSELHLGFRRGGTASLSTTAQ